METENEKTLQGIQDSEDVLESNVFGKDDKNTKSPSQTQQESKKKYNSYCLHVEGFGFGENILSTGTNGMNNSSENDKVVNKRYRHRDVDSPNERVERDHPTSSDEKRDQRKILCS